jgi:hypothetical protein
MIYVEQDGRELPGEKPGLRFCAARAEGGILIRNTRFRWVDPESETIKPAQIDDDGDH